MARLVGNEMGKELCDLLGMPADVTSDFELEFKADNAARIKVTQYVKYYQWKLLMKVLQKCKFINRRWRVPVIIIALRSVYDIRK